MKLNIKRSTLLISSIWIVPIILILVEALLFLRTDKPALIYYCTFWVIRILLTPLIIFFTFRFWSDLNKMWRLAITHLIGFILFVVLFSSISYVLLFNLLRENQLFVAKDATPFDVMTTILDNSISINVIMYLSTVVICYTMQYFKKAMEANTKAEALERSLITSRLEFLKSQLNSHFLFNTLHTINSFVIRKQTEEASKMLLGLGDLLRFSLKDNKQQLIPLKQELELLDVYLDIQRTRFKERLQVCLEHSPSLDDALIPTLILQPIVENAVKYAIEPFTHTGIIMIRVTKAGARLCVTIKDNGQTDFDEIQFNKGIGLNNTRERLLQLFGNDQSFGIKRNRPAGVEVFFEIPFQMNMHATT